MKGPSLAITINAHHYNLFYWKFLIMLLVEDYPLEQGRCRAAFLKQRD
jgi:hypothetical protein